MNDLAGLIATARILSFDVYLIHINGRFAFGELIFISPHGVPCIVSLD